MSNNKYDFLYPHHDDKNFNAKIYMKKEFNDVKYDGTIHDVKIHSDILCNTEIDLLPHQLFVRNFLSFQTPYNSLLLYHGLGTGKTCSAISVCEETRDYLKQVGISKRIIIVASPNVQENFKLELFNPEKLKLIDGLWNIRGCTSNKFIKEINPMSMKGIPRDKVVRQVRRIINQSYLFLGYIEFANYIDRIMKKHKSDEENYERKIANSMKKEFSNRLIVIDEVHNIRMTDDNTNKKIAQNLFKLINYSDNTKLLLLSATPMFNSHLEILWLLNLMNMNDKRAPIHYKQIFDKDGSLKVSSDGEEIGKELLIRKMTGYVSFIKGDNPYLFPYRIFPSAYESKNTIQNFTYPRKQVNGKEIIVPLEHIDVYVNGIGEYQNNGYQYIIEKLQDQIPSEEEKEYGLGYQLLDAPIQALNFLYPSEIFDNLRSDEGNQTDLEQTVNIRSLIGKNGLDRCMKYERSTKKKFEYTEDTLERYGKIFSKNEVGKYSKKIESICDKILESNGITMIYSQYIDGGCVPVALALEELGFKRYGERKNSLFRERPSQPLNAYTMKPRVEGEEFKQASYAMITGDVLLSPNNKTEFLALTNENNVDGNTVKVVIISKAGSEGLDFKFIRNIHILDPWYNMNRIEQIIGRGVRTCSHKLLTFNKRNVCIYLHSTYINEEEETVDMYIYRLAEIKSKKIGTISRLLKENAVDCLLNVGQQNFTSENMKQRVKQQLSNGITIDFNVGDKPYTSTCDYMETCSYKCIPDTPEDVTVNEDTYNEKFIVLNIEKITQRIRNIFLENYILKKDRLVREINAIKEYPLIQINVALTQLIDDKNEYIQDMFGRTGHLINVGSYYMFQPIELASNKKSLLFDKIKPIDYKKEKIIIDTKKMKKESSELLKQQMPKVTKLVILDKSEKQKRDPKTVSSTKKKTPEQLSTYGDAKKIIGNISENFQNAFMEHESLRGDKNWYKHASRMITRLLDEKLATDKQLKIYIIQHSLDNLLFNDLLSISKYLLLNDKLTSFEDVIKKQIEKNIIEKDDLRILLLHEFGELRPYTISDGELTPSKTSQLEKVSAEIIANRIPLDMLNNIVGFISEFKKSYMTFKTKNLSTKRSQGTRCDQSGKQVVIDRYNEIVGKIKYSSDELKLISSTELCSEMEIMLRLFDEKKREGKRWYLSPIEAIVTNIDKLKS